MALEQPRLSSDATMPCGPPYNLLFMFAFEVLLPAFAPLLTFGLLNVLKRLIIFPFRIGTYAFIRLAEVTEPFKPEVPISH